jgi:SAM-dependent methyltransferase
MPIDAFCCPTCKRPLITVSAGLTCTACDRVFPIVNNIPDFFVIDGDQEIIDLVSRIWQDERIVKARDTVYRLRTRELKGMIFCMQEIAQRTGEGVRILEIGMGTGHFTCWMAELAAPGTEIYAFDCSWPIIQTAQENLRGLSTVTLFRANARGKLPFPEQYFDILFLRLAPLGSHGVPNVAVGFQLLKPGGWYFEAGWDRPQYEIPWIDWAIQHGFENAEHHTWHYPRLITEEEQLAWQIEQGAFPADHKGASPRSSGKVRMTTENLLIAQKPN